MKSGNGEGIDNRKLKLTKKVNSKPISDRIYKITINLNDRNRLIVLSGYAPTVEKSKKNPEEAENFYNVLSENFNQ